MYVDVSDAENNRSAYFDWHDFIRTDIKCEMLLHILLFGLALFVKFMILTCLFKKIPASLVDTTQVEYIIIIRFCIQF